MIGCSVPAARAVTAVGAHPVQGDMSNQAELQKGMEGTEVVFHVAAMFKLWGKRQEFDAVNVKSMQRLVGAAVACPSLRKIVYVSAAAVIMGDPKPIVRADETVCRFSRKEPFQSPMSVSRTFPRSSLTIASPAWR